jgi:exodeoxyribonuclease VII large subunit
MQTVTLSELAFTIKDAISGNLAPSYWVTAEIGDMKVNAKGHCYLELLEKDHQQVKAKLRAAIWAYDFRNINQWFEKITGNSLRQGIKILANAQVSFHEIYGLNLTIKDIDPNFTIGERERKKQEVISRLTEELLIDRNKGLVLPVVPQRIAVISSSTAAGYGDFLHQLDNNKKQYAVSTKLFPVTLQGDEAERAILGAIEDISKEKDDFDAIVVIRGGGAQLDLDVFNEYNVCAAIANALLPVLTGIGHERDETIADMVAHTRLKTPTAVADFILEGFEAFTESIQWMASRLLRQVDEEMRGQKHLLGQLSKDLNYLARQQMAQGLSYINSVKRDIAQSAKWKIERERNRLREVSATTIHTVNEQLKAAKNQLAMAEKSIEASDPKKVLARGYSITTLEGKLLKNSKLKNGDSIVTHYSHGVLTSQIKSLNDHE